MFGKDPLAFTVNNISATLNMETVALEVEKRFGKGRMDVWTRMDLHDKTHKTKNKGRTDLERRCMQSDS